VLFLFVLILTLVIFRSSAAWVYYEGQLKGGRG
jgi:multiple sugar transport system permease protein